MSCDIIEKFENLKENYGGEENLLALLLIAQELHYIKCVLEDLVAK